MKKVVLEANSSSDGDDQRPTDTNDGEDDKHDHDHDDGHDDGGHDNSKGSTKKKKKKKRAGKKFRNKGDSVKGRSGDSTPMLNQGEH